MLNSDASPEPVGQSRRMSLIEAITNVTVGYALAIVTQVLVFPWFDIETGLREHLTIGLAFVGVSLLRGYLLRRFFETLRRGNRLGGGRRFKPKRSRSPPGSEPR